MYFNQIVYFVEPTLNKVFVTIISIFIIIIIIIVIIIIIIIIIILMNFEPQIYLV